MSENELSKQQVRYQINFKKKLEDFHTNMILLGYQLVATKDVATDIVQKGLIPPKNASGKNLTQLRYEFISRNGYRVIIYPGVQGGVFKKGLCSWVYICDEQGEDFWSRMFLRDILFWDKLLAYAHGCKLAVMDRPHATEKLFPMKLVEVSITQWVWKYRKTTLPFSLTDFRNQLPADRFRLIAEKEFERTRYYTTRRTAKEYRRDIRKRNSSWKVRQKQNS